VSPYTQAWLGAFAFTQVVEVPIWAYALRRHRKLGPDGRPWPVWACAALGFAASFITHPYVWFVFPGLIPHYVTMVVVAEVFAVGVEALYAGLLGLRWPLAWSLLANAASALLGLASRERFGWP